MELKTMLKAQCKEIGVILTEEMAEQFMEYKRLLLSWNEKMNLTAITEEKEVIQKHFVDSLSFAEVFSLAPKARVIDVGTGAGFPGIPMKIAFPNITMTLLDSLNKRITFLEEVVKSLSLSDIFLYHGRAEDMGQTEAFRENFDICVSRAVANLSVLSEYCLPFVCVGGTFLALKGPDVSKELEESMEHIKILGGHVESVKKVHLPDSDITHSIVIIKKICHTPSKYPRKAGKILKGTKK